MYEVNDEWAFRDDLDTMEDYEGQLESGGIDAMEEAFIRGFEAAA